MIADIDFLGVSYYIRPAMIPTIECWLLSLCSGVAAIGYGSGLARFLRIRPNVGDRGILGLFFFGLLGCVLHFAVALSMPVQVAVLAVGAMLAAVLWHDIRADASLGPVVAAGLFIFVLLHPQALPGPDDSLYYLQTFKWNREFPITMGLGNLHGRLAFNSILFLIAPLSDRTAIGWIPNLLAVTFVMQSLFSRLPRIDLSDGQGNIQFWFVALALSILVVRPVWLGVLSADSVAAVLIVYWVALALGLSRAADRRTILGLLVISAALAATAKISAAPLLALTAALGWVHRKQGVVGGLRVWAVASALLMAWMVRGVLLSGCAVYPVQQTCFSGLPWAVSAQQVTDEKMAIQSWARRRGVFDLASVLRDWSWFPFWLDSARKNTWMELLLVGVVLGALAVASGGATIRDQLGDGPGLIALGLVSCLAFWFLSAPNVRFGLGYILSTALFGIGLAAAAWLHHPRFYSYAPKGLILLVALLGLHSLEQLRAENYFYAIPEVAVYQLPTPQGSRLWVPSIGDQCWAHQLPCTPYVNSAALARVHWPAPWPYRYDASTEPPQGWTPMFDVADRTPFRRYYDRAKDHHQ